MHLRLYEVKIFLVGKSFKSPLFLDLASSSQNWLLLWKFTLTREVSIAYDRLKACISIIFMSERK